MRNAKTRLLLRKDALFTKQREEENQQQAVVQQILKAAPSDDLMLLTSRREIVPFLNNFKEIRNHLKKHKVPDWRTKLLKMGKGWFQQKKIMEFSIKLAGWVLDNPVFH